MNGRIFIDGKPVASHEERAAARAQRMGGA
jgi:hypothetical protein